MHMHIYVHIHIHRSIRPDIIVIFWFCRSTSKIHPNVTMEHGDSNSSVSGTYVGGSYFEPWSGHRLFLRFSVIFLKFRNSAAKVCHNRIRKKGTCPKENLMLAATVLGKHVFETEQINTSSLPPSTSSSFRATVPVSGVFLNG